MSQAEAALHFLAPAYLDYTVNGSLRSAVGNEDLELSPHDFYRCAGEDRWVALAVSSDDQWRSLCGAIGRPELKPRRGDREAVDEAITGWTRERDASEVAHTLQALGIAAHEAVDTPGLYADEQLKLREHYYPVTHEIYQTHTLESSRLRFSRSQEKRAQSALSFGRDNRYVLETILGLSEARIEELIEAGALG
jgi:benzylsuccinate CoA-transferase BbsF subunit